LWLPGLYEEFFQWISTRYTFKSVVWEDLDEMEQLGLFTGVPRRCFHYRIYFASLKTSPINRLLGKVGFIYKKIEKRFELKEVNFT